MTVIEMQAKRAAAAQKLKDLHTAASTRAFTEDEQRAWDSTKAEIADWDARIARQSEIDAEDERQRAAGLAAQPPVAGGAGAGRIEGVRDLEGMKPFRNFGEYLQSVQRAAAPGAVIDKRLMALQERAVTGQGEGIGSDGGFLVQQDHIKDLSVRAVEASQIAKLCTKATVGPNSNGANWVEIEDASRVTASLWGGVVAYWANEADTVAAGKLKTEARELKLSKLMALWYVTDEQLADSTQLGSVGQQCFIKAMARKLDDSIINGDGGGKPMGILNSPALITVSKEGSQAADTVLQANISKMWARLLTESESGAVWLCNKDVTPQFDTLHTAVKNVAGTENVGGFSQLVYNADKQTLKNRPIVTTDFCKTLGDLGDLYLVNMADYLLIEKGGVEAAQSMHVRFLYGENTFRFTWRVNGMPLLRTAITPANGSNTLSSYIALQAR